MKSAVGFLLSPIALFTLRFSLSPPMAPIYIGKHAGILAVNIDEQMIEALPKWRAFALSRTGIVDDADDLASRTNVKILERHRTSPFEPDTNIEAFGITVIRNLIIDDARSRQTRKTDNVDNIDDAGGPSASNPETSIFTQEILRFINQLSKACREILTLCGAGYSYAEIAEALDIEIGTVQSRLFRCRQKLKSLMELDTLYDWDSLGDPV